MKKTHFLDLLRNIKSNLVSFVAIVLFVSLGIALFCGLSWIRYSTNGYLDSVYKEGNVHALELTFPLGIDQDGVDAISALSEVEHAEGVRSVNGIFSFDGTKYQANVRQLTNVVDPAIYVNGHLPTQSGEIAVETSWANKVGLEIGDTLTFDEINDGGAHIVCDALSFDAVSLMGGATPSANTNVLKSNVFTITALVENAAYFQGGVISYGMSPVNRFPTHCIMFLSEESFATESFPGYTSVVVEGKGLSDLYVFSNEYITAEKNFKNIVKNTADKLATERFNAFSDKVAEMEQFGITLPNLPSESACYITARTELESYLMCKAMNKIQFNSGITLASLFVVVGLLVCYSALTRIINGQTKLIGAKKALGMKEREIRLFYFGFSGIALFAGAALGILFGIFIVEPILLTALKSVFVISEFTLAFSPVEALIIIGIEAVFILFATWLAVNKTLKRSAVTLLAGAQENLNKTGFYEKTKAYKRLGLLSQIIVNNFFKDRRRVIGTVIGVIGSTALIVTAITYQNVIGGSFQTHYDKYYHFDTVVYYGNDDGTSPEKISQTLGAEGIDNAIVLSENIVIKNGDDSVDAADLFVPFDKTAFSKLVTLTSVNGSNMVDFSGVWLSKAYQKEYGLKNGDTLSIIGLDGQTREVAVTGFVEHYLMNVQCYMDKETYAEIFGREAVANACILNSNGRELSEIRELFNQAEIPYSPEDYKEYTRRIFDVIGDLANTVVFVYVVLAIAMSVLVLLNLLSMFVSEKKRELLMLLIYGYSLRDAKRYIYSDTILLAAVGSILGAPLGELFGNIAAAAYETANVVFHYSFVWQAALIGIVVSAILTFIMSAISLRKIKKYQLTDINQ